jgi:hypothetical protein
VKTFAIAAAVTAITLPGSNASATGGFAFGRHGGNIKPLEVHIFPSGRVVVNGRLGGLVKRERMAALRRLVEQQRFFVLPAHIVCAGVLPDVATRSASASTHGKVKAVTARGGCNARFDKIYAALARAAGVTGR